MNKHIIPTPSYMDLISVNFLLVYKTRTRRSGKFSKLQDDFSIAIKYICGINYSREQIAETDVKDAVIQFALHLVETMITGLKTLVVHSH